MLTLSGQVTIPDDELEFSGIRAQGAGGQNVNKVSSAVHLRFDIVNSSLPEFYKERLLECSDQRISKDGVVIIKAQQYRSQQKNKDEALLRLKELIGQATTVQKQRKPTRPTRSAKRKRLDSKKKHGRTKALRGNIEYGFIAALCLWAALAAGTVYYSGAPAVAAEYEHIGANGLRMDHYRGTTPDTVPNGKTIDTPALMELIETEQPLLIDVFPVTVRPELADFGISWLPNEPRYHIPGSVWLPNVGYGELDDDMEAYFRDNLQRLSDDDPQRAIVIYCLLDCWMAWNAVQRAAGYGYTNMYWYRSGSDGWQEHGLELAEGTPLPLDEEAAGTD